MARSSTPAQPVSTPPSGLVIFANSPASETPYFDWCAGAAHEALLITTPDLAPTYRERIATQTVGAAAPPGERETLASAFLAGKSGASRLVCRGEYDVLRAARLREAFALAGPYPADCLAYRDKDMMKRLVRAAGLPCPRHYRVETLSEARRTLEAEGGRMILKPIDGSGGIDTRVIASAAELEAAWGDPLHPPLLAEQYVEAPAMVHVDGLMDETGLLFVHVSRYFNDCLAWRNNRPVGSLSLPTNHPWHAPSVAALKAVLPALPFPGATAFHAEFFVTGAGPVFCEIGCRSPGARIVRQIYHETGVDLDRLWCLQQLGRAGQVRAELAAIPIAEHRRAGLCAHLLMPPRAGRLAERRAPALPPWVVEAWDRSETGRVYPGATKSGDWLTSYVVRAPTVEALETRVARLVTLDRAANLWTSTEPAHAPV